MPTNIFLLHKIFFRIVPQHHVDDEGVADEPGEADQRVEDLDDGHDPGGQTGRARGATPHQALQLQLCNNRKYFYEDFRKINAHKINVRQFHIFDILRYIFTFHYLWYFQVLECHRRTRWSSSRSPRSPGSRPRRGWAQPTFCVFLRATFRRCWQTISRSSTVDDETSLYRAPRQSSVNEYNLGKINIFTTGPCSIRFCFVCEAEARSAPYRHTPISTETGDEAMMLVCNALSVERIKYNEPWSSTKRDIISTNILMLCILLS